MAVAMYPPTLLSGDSGAPRRLIGASDAAWRICPSWPWRSARIGHFLQRILTLESTSDPPRPLGTSWLSSSHQADPQSTQHLSRSIACWRNLLIALPFNRIGRCFGNIASVSNHPPYEESAGEARLSKSVQGHYTDGHILSSSPALRIQHMPRCNSVLRLSVPHHDASSRCHIQAKA